MNHLFVPEPVQWGFRGDPYLWRELRRRGKNSTLPMKIEKVHALLAEMIEGVLDVNWQHVTQQEHWYHPSLAHGGMSSGMISVEVWTERLIPLLLARAQALIDYPWDATGRRDPLEAARSHPVW
jgi:molybdenum cofactor cytidylyltransferase